MTAIAPDLPDWTKQDSAGTIYVNEASIAAFDSVTFGLVGVASYVIFALPESGEDVRMAVQYQVNPQFPIPIATAFVTAYSAGGALGSFAYESPSYGGVGVVENLGDSTLNLLIMSSNRVVETPRILTDLSPGQVFDNSAASLVGGTPIVLTPKGDLAGGYTANYDAAFTVDSPVTGPLEFQFLDAQGNQQSIPIGDAVVGVASFGPIPLPQCIGQIGFTPDTSDPSGIITVVGSPSHT